ncbi:MarR family transcriptional regulator [Aquabacterium fontiphilum]|uniref:MarR family winged helix-turn-helix transcriptional regulator n=1 Tax=Aquabacterium fontiphilum TaxID=450365 RepID=UPI001376FBFC|nr:MarR family transcriptional regulator [Aquabacterium fontiphilum]NBD19986.1 MarR family transcriptional regulator [Aquabacterium fontiphilum]
MSDVRPCTTDAPLLRLDQQLCFALYTASLAMTRHYKPLLAPLGLTYPQYLVMLVLWEQDAPAVHELGARLHLDSGTLTPLLKRLEQAGLVSRHRDAGDERRVRISLTEAGRTLKARALGIPAKVACGLNRSPKELLALRAQLMSLQAELAALDHDPESTD